MYIAAGIVIDVTIKNIEKVKDAIINTISKIETHSFADNLFYIYNPYLTVIPKSRGQQIASIFYHEANPKIDPEIALKQTTYVIGYEDPSLRKYIILITDKYKKELKIRYEKAIKINKKENFNCKFIFIGLDNQEFDDLDVKIESIEIENLEKVLLENINETFE